MRVTASAGRALPLRRTLQRPPASLTTRRTHSTKSDQPSGRSPGASAPDATSKTIPGPSWLWLEPLATPFRYYSRAQRRRPYWTQFFSALAIYFCGDLSAQGLASSEPYDPLRTARALVIGGLSSIPSYRWFLWLSNSFNYASKTLSLATKVAVNQLLFTPVFNSYFFGMQTLLSGGGPREVLERIRHTVPVSWWNSCKLWPAVTAFSFTFVRPQNRSVFAGELNVCVVIGSCAALELTFLCRCYRDRVANIFVSAQQEGCG